MMNGHQYQENGFPRQRTVINPGNQHPGNDSFDDVQLRHPERHQVPNGHHMRSDQEGPTDTQYYDGLGYDDLFDQLPSRQLETVAELASRTVLNKKSAHRTTMRINRDTDLEDQFVFSLQNDLDNDDYYMDNIDGAVRTIPTTLSKKRSIKHRLSKKRKKKLTRSKLIKYWFAMGWQHTKHELRKLTHLFNLWRSHLMIIEGCFGTSVVSYFIFLKWVLLINIPIFLLTFSFLVIPQILYRYYLKDPPGYEGENKQFTGLEILTGAGFFENSEMYYGVYTNETVEITPGYVYQMKYAYLFTAGGYYLFCLIILGFSYLRSYRKYYIQGRETVSLYLFNTVVCGWDYGIRSHEASQLKQKNLYNEFKEFLSTKKSQQPKPGKDEVAKKWLIRLVAWLGVVILLSASGYATYAISTELSITSALENVSSIPVVSSLAMPVVISAMQLVIPMLFTLIESFEDYTEPKYELYVHMFRDVALKCTLLGVLMYFWLQIAPTKLTCWETFVGQEIYRLVIMDFLFTIGYTLIMEFFRKLLSLKWEKIERAEFAIGRHTLELVYSQSLCWLGIFFAPLLPVVVILKLIIIFYVKRYSVVKNCRPSAKHWRASQTHTIFVGYLFVLFLLTCVAVGCSIFLIKPSDTCGPYQSYETSYDVIKNLIDGWQQESDIVKEIFDFIDSPGFISGLLIVLCVVLYYSRTIMNGHRKMVDQLKTQLASEGKDKKFLMNLLNEVKIRGRRVSAKPGPILNRTKEANTPDRDSPEDNIRFASLYSNC